MLPTEYRYRKDPIKIAEESRVTPFRMLVGASTILGILFYPFERNNPVVPPVQYNSVVPSIDSLADSTRSVIDSGYQITEQYRR